MYICICKAVTDSAIREAVCQGACRMRDLKAGLGVSAQCGKCACHVKAVLEEALSKQDMMQPIQREPGRLYEAAA
ncbi:MAG: bacterioferritin-associated ferredoxin [Pseudomonadota bacterium]